MKALTVYSRRFLDEANQTLNCGLPSTGQGLSKEERTLLQHTIAHIEKGIVVLMDYESVEEWLERLRNHHP